MSTSSTLMTADEFSAMAHERPSELIRGELVEMTSPGSRHGLICSNAAFILQTWSRQQRESYLVVTNDSGVQTSASPDTVRGPDLFVIRRTRLPGATLPIGHLTVAPDLCIEVASPSDRWSEIMSKVGELLQSGVAHVWVIEPEHRHLHVFQADDEPAILFLDQIVQAQVLPGFQCLVSDFFYGV